MTVAPKKKFSVKNLPFFYPNSALNTNTFFLLISIHMSLHSYNIYHTSTKLYNRIKRLNNTDSTPILLYNKYNIVLCMNVETGNRHNSHIIALTHLGYYIKSFTEFLIRTPIYFTGKSYFSSLILNSYKTDELYKRHILYTVDCTVYILHVPSL